MMSDFLHLSTKLPPPPPIKADVEMQGQVCVFKLGFSQYTGCPTLSPYLL